MKALISIFKVRFALTLQYRAAAFFGAFTQFFFGFVMIMIYDAFYQSTLKSMPMTFSQTATYIWLGQGLLGLLPWNGDREIQLQIRSGDFAYEILRPIDIYSYWYFKILAQRMADTMLRLTPLFLISFFIIPEPFNLNGPASITSLFLFALSLISAVILGCTVSNIITISTLFTLGDGIQRLATTLVTIFSGMIIPLSFFPEWSQMYLKIQPFNGLVDMPFKFYLGIYREGDIIFALIHQFIWTLVFFLTGKYMVMSASNRVIVQGG